MRSVQKAWLALATVALLAGCPAPGTSLVHGQETAQEFNLDARFGRNELLLPHVAPELRDAFAAHHRDWGSGIRIAELELTGMHNHGDHEIDMVVRIAWYRPEEEDLRVTSVQQRWRDQGGWQLVEEKRASGDIGLLGENVVYQAPEDRRPSRFPTVRLGGQGEAP